MTAAVGTRRPEPAELDETATLSIAETADRTGVTVHTLRYYERIGLLDGVGRDTAGYRFYTAADIRRVVFLTRLRMTGMPIRGLQRYVGLIGGGPSTEPERLAMLEAHRDAVRRQIQQLRVSLETVDHKIAAYRGRAQP